MAVDFDGSIRIKPDENAGGDDRDLASFAEKINDLAACVGAAFGIAELPNKTRFAVKTGAVDSVVDSADNSGDHAVNSAFDNAEKSGDHAINSAIVNAEKSGDHAVNSAIVNTEKSEDHAANSAIANAEKSEDHSVNSAIDNADNSKNCAAGHALGNIEVYSDTEPRLLISANAINTEMANSESLSQANNEPQNVDDYSDTELRSEISANAISGNTVKTEQPVVSELTNPQNSAIFQAETFSALDGFGDINSAVDSLKILSAPSGYVSSNTVAFAAERNLNIHLNVGGINYGERTVRTNGASVNINRHDLMINNGGGQ